VTFFPSNIPFPDIRLDDFLRQAANDIITILTQPQSPTTPTLQAGDPVRNALLTLATQLKRIDNIPEPLPPPVSLPRVDRALPRVDRAPQSRNKILTQQSSYTPATALQTQSNKPKNIRFNNKTEHRYPLRSLQRRTKYNTTPATHSQGTNFKNIASRVLVAQHIFQYKAAHIFRPNGTKETIDSMLSGPSKDIWEKSLSNEWGRLAQGNKHGVRSTDTIEFIHQHDVPSGRDVTYASFILDHRPLKTETHRIRITVGGDRLTYDDDAGSPAANLLETKVLLNSTISDAAKGARFMTADIMDYFLATPMARAEYMKVKYKHIPQDIKDRYQLEHKVTDNDYIYIKIKKGMYGLKQAAILAYDNLQASLKPFGYEPVIGTVGIWQHNTRPTTFCLCVDDFGIRYSSKHDAQNLLDSIGANYKYTCY
jgi:hypothetical protein